MIEPPYSAGTIVSALTRVLESGLPYDGPEIEWQSGVLACTTPEPHIALDEEYMQDNGLEADAAQVIEVAFQAGFENGYRDTVKRCHADVMRAQSDVQTALGIHRLNRGDPKHFDYIEDRLSDSLDRLHSALAEFGTEMPPR